MTEPYEAPAFLRELLHARSPSGYETEAQAVVDRHVRDAADTYEKDPLGQRIAVVHPAGKPSVLLAGHMDELGFIVTYVDERGFLYFDTIGGIDLNTIAGRRVAILTKEGVVRGVTGKRAIHLLSAEERKKTPEKENLWIDIGAKTKAEALTRVRIGDVAVYDDGFSIMHGSIGMARAFDDKVGCYAVMETLRRVSASREGLEARLISVATAQEEIGCRGARTVANRMRPDFAIAVDVGHATDHPECDNKKFGEFKLGGGPILTRGANIHPMVFDRLEACARDLGIPYQIEADPRPTGTDGRELQMGHGGVATGVVSIPLRYMHTAAEIVDLADVERTVRLLEAFVRSLTRDDVNVW
jgi:putative aminopeptidase FrvX